MNNVIAHALDLIPWNFWGRRLNLGRKLRCDLSDDHNPIKSGIPGLINNLQRDCIETARVSGSQLSRPDDIFEPVDNRSAHIAFATFGTLLPPAREGHSQGRFRPDARAAPRDRP